MLTNHLLDLDDVYTALTGAEHYDALWNKFIEYLTHVGVDLISYYYTAPLDTAHMPRMDILSYGYPQAWQQHYRKQSLYKHDPIYNAYHKMLRPVKWSDIAQKENLTPQETSFITEFYEWMKGDGYAIPAFGPSGQNACFGIGNIATIEDWDMAAVRRIEWICWQFHLSYCVLRLKEFPENFSLTDQDRMILQKWGGRRNISIIAEEMDASPKDIHALINKIMQKMNVTDSQSLMIRAKHLGLIKE